MSFARDLIVVSISVFAKYPRAHAVTRAARTSISKNDMIIPNALFIYTDAPTKNVRGTQKIGAVVSSNIYHPEWIRTILNCIKIMRRRIKN
jgi:hypothetical protein